MSSPALDLYQRHRLTVHDFHRMGEAGILPVEARLELIEGEIIAIAPIGSRHAATVTRANMLFVQAVTGRAIVSVQNPIILGEHSERSIRATFGSCGFSPGSQPAPKPSRRVK
jgi:hypothetical protein